MFNYDAMGQGYNNYYKQYTPVAQSLGTSVLANDLEGLLGFSKQQVATITNTLSQTFDTNRDGMDAKDFSKLFEATDSINRDGIISKAEVQAIYSDMNKNTSQIEAGYHANAVGLEKLMQENKAVARSFGTTVLENMLEGLLGFSKQESSKIANGTMQRYDINGDGDLQANELVRLVRDTDMNRDGHSEKDTEIKTFYTNILNKS